MQEPLFAIEEVVGGAELRLRGELTLSDCMRLRDELTQAVGGSATLLLNLEGVKRIDGAAAAILGEVKQCAQAAGGDLIWKGANDATVRVLALYTQSSISPGLQPPPSQESILGQIGREAALNVSNFEGMLAFLGRAFLALLQAMRFPRSINWRDFWRMSERHGADGMPIALMIALLMGLITAFQAALQMKRFGADYLVADLVSLSITRELGPLMTAIVVAGRSGAAIAAELGTMKVSEELDALKTLGLCPYRFLVFPRVLALMVVLPAMILVANVVGISGGVLVAMRELDITLGNYLTSTRDALDLWSTFGGVIKGVVFGALIGLTACERGLSTKGGAEGVGRSTTSAVVSTLFGLVVADALFSIIFNLFDI